MIHIACPNPAIDRILLLDILHANSVNRPIEVREFIGGKGLNVLRGLQFEGGVEPKLHCIMDEFSALHAKSVLQNAKLIPSICKEKIRTCQILIAKNGLYPIYEKGKELDASTISSFYEGLIKELETDDFLAFSGSMPLGMNVDFIAKTQQGLKQAQKPHKLCIDSSGEALKHAYLNCEIHFLKINDEEARELFANKKLCTLQDFMSYMQNTAKDNIPIFIITLGKNGVLARINGRFFHGSCPVEDVKSPIACGDFFFARFLRGLALKEELELTLGQSLLYAAAKTQSYFPQIEPNAMKGLQKSLQITSL